MNATEDPENTGSTENTESTGGIPRHPAETGGVDRAAPPAGEPSDESNITGIASSEHEGAAPSEGGSEPPVGDPSEAAEDTGNTSVYVRHGRTPTLGFWVTVLLVAPMVVALIISPFFDFQDVSSVVTFVLIAAVFVGVPLAAVAAAIDAFLHRRGGPRGR
ncbi:hypothetical protein [Brachybacterium sacelli]|uniref:Uncharacterized protein n=1 Tax=Brachybacterium sacelli TaxID=173364 RepID=A0ABS4X0L7_9MICO|nr:hypothetical protein [Brachybacterium sacelli]MBP2382005.1 hypothetical protein [Brachybacterium sacelli]